MNQQGNAQMQHGQHEMPEMTNHAQQKHLQQCDAVEHDYQGYTWRMHQNNSAMQVKLKYYITQQEQQSFKNPMLNII